MGKSGIIKFIEENERLDDEYRDLEKNNPPKQIEQEQTILKKAGEDISKEQFDLYLEKVRWRTWPRGCKHYAIYNHKDQMTNFSVYEYDDKKHLELELIWEELMFGGDYCGILKNDLRDAKITYCNMGYLWLTWGSFTIHFGNHDRVLKKSEEYLRSLPKDFETRVYCSDCNKLQTKSYKKSALYLVMNSLSMGLSKAFGSPPACEKCGSTTFGDLNIHTDMFYYRVSTGRRVKYETLKKIAKKQRIKYDDLLRIEKNEETTKKIREENKKKE